MDHIKKEKLQAMNKYKKNQFLNNLILYSLIVIGCILFCSSPLWLPPIYSFMKIFLFVYVPYMKTYISSPKCLFILCNIIVVVLIGESKLVGSKSSPTTDIYDEYLSRSVSLRESRNTTTLVKKKNNKEEVIRMDAFENVKQSGYDEGLYEEMVEGVKRGGGEDKTSDEKNLNIDEKLVLPTEELNRRVEDFIARINKQRRLEALLCSTSD
ncbi:hypothetical protein AQUCO_01100096v1 [Aquilegia coerulea]|uniref:DUF4408 domain-containing protein n=1 Tax=Aquilegia coerulea TaxID=218851 RepID=A0A2G5E5N9_AQUCA|nr:hypothetical protein AQUCO_01100096v1 [Aquilegia coerulea]